MERLNLKNHFFAVFPKFKKKLNVMTFLSFQQTLTCLFESVYKNLEVVWKKEGHTSSAQLPQVSFSKSYSK